MMETTREQLFAVLVREHEQGLAAFVRACVCDPADAEDLVQETFVTAWHELDAYDLNRPFAAWLRGVARHLIGDYFQRCAAAGRHVHLLPPEAVADLADEFGRFNRPARGEVYRDCFAALQECLAVLSTSDREIVQRAYRENQTCRTIAAQLGHTVEAVKKRLQRVRAALRDCILSKLGPEGVPHA
jgi:RNA polymerase sigma-70 factor (ECF subfamily)